MRLLWIVLPFWVSCGSASGGSQASATALIAPAGGVVELEGFGSVEFPAGAFESARRVTLTATSSPETQAEYEVTGELYSAGPRAEYELRVRTGETAPAVPVRVSLSVPGSLTESLPAGYEVRVFGQVFQDGGEEILDSFELLPTELSGAGERASAEVGPEAFTDRRGTGGEYEAVLVLGSVPKSRAPDPNEE